LRPAFSWPSRIEGINPYLAKLLIFEVPRLIGS
jgi:hypothetical protein